jgi:tRNA(Ile)-lysidine synthase
LSLRDRFAAAMDLVLAGARPETLCVAVSGGSDSLALLALTCDWAGPDIAVDAVTVDHGLRDGSAQEARQVALEARNLGARHTVLRWQGWDGSGNLQAKARTGRRRLIADHCAAKGIAAVLLGHTQNDQAETLLMRLARGSGVDGLAAMSAGRCGETLFLRPLLDETRADLRDFLTARGMSWVNDPSNDDPRFERVRMRRAMAELGLDAARLAETATAMARARLALETRAHDVAQEIVTETNGLLSFDAAALGATEEETRLRLVAHALKCLSSAPYRPRLATLAEVLASALAGRSGTLHGCHLIPHRGRLLICREYQVVAELQTAAGDGVWWDNRWHITAPDLPGARIRALGADGLKQMPRPDGFPHAALTSFPGLWQGDNLCAVPGFLNDNLMVYRYAPSASFHRTILSH